MQCLVVYMSDGGSPYLCLLPAFIVEQCNDVSIADTEYVCYAIKGGYNKLEQDVNMALWNHFDSILPYLEMQESRKILQIFDFACPHSRAIVSFVEQRAAKTIQKHWRMAISNPMYTTCRKRLLREFVAMA